MRFSDRDDAGRQLARALLRHVGEDLVVLGLPRGGVPVAWHVAAALDAPLDVIVVRKLGLPWQPELAMGAVGEGGVLVTNDDVLARAGITADVLDAAATREREEVERRARRFRGDASAVPLAGRVAILVDDGVATGATARAACLVARAQGAARVVLALPVGSPDTVEELRRVADEVVCLSTPIPFWAVGQGYRDFEQVSDETVLRLLAQARVRRGVLPQPEPADPLDLEVEVDADGVTLGGHLTVPVGARGLVVFAHGSGSSRHSPRNRHVAGVLQEGGFGTLLFDLLTPVEEHDRDLVFDIGFLAARLGQVTGWIRRQQRLSTLPLGYFGASTGAGAALWAAAEPGSDVAAVVSRGGRPDLAAPRLGEVRAPTLLIVGSRDTVVLDLNRQAEAMLRCEAELAVVPGATHLFEEPGTLDEAARLALDWFTRHLSAG